MTTLALKKIKLDGGTQSRTKINEQVVEEYADAMLHGAKFPAVDVFYDGNDYWLADGFHRVRGAQKGLLTKIEAKIHQGTQRDAVLFSVGANDSHGLRRSNEDKRLAVLRLLADEEWGRKPETWIAKTCKVSRSLVRAVIGESPYLVEKQDKAEREVTRGGTTYTLKTANIGKKEKPTSNVVPLREPVEPEPGEPEEVDSPDSTSSPPRQPAQFVYRDGKRVAPPSADDIAIDHERIHNAIDAIEFLGAMDISPHEYLRVFPPDSNYTLTENLASSVQWLTELYELWSKRHEKDHSQTA